MKHASRIAAWELRFEAVRSGGPGGQHVNKTSSAVIMRWNVPRTGSFTAAEKLRLLEKLGPMLSGESDLIVRSEEFRSQEMNRKKCVEKLDLILQKALFIPKLRKKTRPTRSSVERRHEAKKSTSQKKSSRQKLRFDRD